MVLTGRRWVVTIVLSSIILVVCIVLCSLQGPGQIRFVDLWRLITQGVTQNPDNTRAMILLKIRLPRVLLSAVVGGALAISGAVLQALLRNPLADPYVLGISSGSALGAVVAMLLGLGTTIAALPLVPLCSFLGGLVVLGFVYQISKVHQRISVHTMLLVGVVTAAVLTAIIMFITSVSEPEKVHRIVFWLMGNLDSEEYSLVFAVLFYILLGVLILVYHARDLNLLVLGEESATQLGLDVEQTKKLVIVCSSLITGAAVAVSGLIGFVGIIIPHLTRMIVGSDHRVVLPLSSLTGSIYLVLADTLSRTLISPREIPVGVVTAICGGPFFIYLLKKKSRYLFGA